MRRIPLLAFLVLLSLPYALGEERAVRTTEGKDILNFVVAKGDSFMLRTAGVPHVLRYEKHIPTSRALVFYDEADGKDITVRYQRIPMTGDSVLGQRFDFLIKRPGGKALMTSYGAKVITDNGYTAVGGSFAIRAPIRGRITVTDVGKRYVTREDVLSYWILGKGKVTIGGRRFDVYVGARAGNPLAVDLDGDGKINGKEI
jgi:hypothetical protein